MASATTDVEGTVRDEFFKKIRTNAENNKCIDCEKKNPKWATIHLGLLLCIDCAGKHRAWGPSFSLVRSITLDSWNLKQLTHIEQGGNDRFLDYLRKNGLILSNSREIDYKNNIVTRYKQELGKLVEESLQREEKRIQALSPAEPQKQQTIAAAAAPAADSNTQEQSPTKQSPAGAAQQESKKPEGELINSLLVSKKVQSQQVVFNQDSKTTIAGKSKPKAQKIEHIDFDSLVFDDGVEEAKKVQTQTQQQQMPTVTAQKNEFMLYEEQFPQEAEKKVALQQPTVQQSQQLEKYKTQNVKSISSEAIFNAQDTTVQDKQSYNKFAGASSISSKAFFGQPEEADEGDGREAFNEAVTNFFWNVKEKATDYFERVKENFKK